MKNPIKILFVEDVLTDAEIIWYELSRGKITFEKRLVDNRDDYIDALSIYRPDLIVSDYMLPQFDGMSALNLKFELNPLIPFILVTGSVNEEVAVECMKAGADDYVLKQNLSRLVPAIRAALARKEILLEKEKAERELRENEEKFRSIFENIQDIYYESSMDGTVLEVSPSVLSVSHGQYTREDLLGKSIADFYSFPEERQLLMDALKEKGSISDYEVKLRNRDGSLIFCSVTAKLLFDAGGHPERVVGTMRDISKRKKAQEDLKQSKMEFQDYFESGAVGASVTLPDKKWVEVNQRLCKMFGYTKEELIRMTWVDISHPDDIEKNLDLFQQALDDKIDRYELRKKFVRKDGTIIHMIVSVACERNPDRTVHHFVTSYIDITEQVLAESELIKSKEKAEESDRLKTAFLHNISHEIRTPMNAIIGFAALLTEPGINIDSQKSFIDHISQSSYRLLEILNDIIEESNIEAGILKINKSEANLNKMLEMLLKKYKPKASEKGIGLIFKHGLPDYKVDLVYDYEKINSILSSLLNNAFKFTTRGEVTLGYSLKESNLEFFVSDTGIGITQAHLKKIFDRFYQVENTLNRQYEGTGLGLSIARAYVTLLGGNIWVTSKPGTGSVFYFTIPYHHDEKNAFIEAQINTEKRNGLRGMLTF